MGNGWRDLAGHHAWANAQLLAFCRGLDESTLEATAPGATLERFLAGDWDDERLGDALGDNDQVFAVPAGVFLAQALHHANKHRAYVCTKPSALGYEPPDVSAWAHALATGRMTPKLITIAT